MAAYFSAERVQELLAGQHQVHLHFTDLRETMCVRPYKTERGAEFAKHGFCRRLETLVRSIDRVFGTRNSVTSGVGGEADMPRQPNRRD
jgi:hypothetical protein